MYVKKILMGTLLLCVSLGLPAATQQDIDRLIAQPAVDSGAIRQIMQALDQELNPAQRSSLSSDQLQQRIDNAEKLLHKAQTSMAAAQIKLTEAQIAGLQQQLDNYEIQLQLEQELATTKKGQQQEELQESVLAASKESEAKDSEISKQANKVKELLNQQQKLVQGTFGR